MSVILKWIEPHELSDYLKNGWAEVELRFGPSGKYLIASPEEPASESAKVECPNCKSGVKYKDDHLGPEGYLCPEPVLLVSGGADDSTWDSMLQLFRLVANEQISARKALELAKDFYYERITADDIPAVMLGEPLTGSEPAQPEPVAEEGRWSINTVAGETFANWVKPEPVAKEMPEAVLEVVEALTDAINCYEIRGWVEDAEFCHKALNGLRSFWRTHAAQPAKVRMSAELENVISAAANAAARDYARGMNQAGDWMMDSIAAVRAQAEQGVKK